MLDMQKGLRNYTIVPHHRFIREDGKPWCAFCKRIRSEAHRFDVVRMSCQNANCASERNGWVMVLDLTDKKHADAAKAIETESGKRFAKFLVRDAEDEIERHGGGWGVDLAHLRQVVGNALPEMVAYVFFPGQACLKGHLDREVVFTRESREGAVTHSKPLDWNEDVNESAFRFYRASGRM
jgi:hypothetical protein